MRKDTQFKNKKFLKKIKTSDGLLILLEREPITRTVRIRSK